MDSLTRDHHQPAFYGAGSDLADSILYHARGARMDVEITPRREGATLTLTGQIQPRCAERKRVPELTVELLDPLGVVSTTATNEHGSFRFSGLSSGVYHLRISGAGWKMGVFGLTA